jgi:hypothetical protein
MKTLIESTQELLRFAIAERDAFYDCATDHEGVFNDKHDHDELDRMDAMIDRAQAALADAPGGWKLVPIEPTEDMVLQGFESDIEPEFDGEFDDLSGCQEAALKARLCYAAMLAAAPTPDHIGDANKKPNELTGQLFACDTCDSQTDDPWHYSTPTNRHMHACDVCWPEVQLIMLAETKQALLSRRGVPPEDMAAAIQLEDEA